jgi:hypothetical protein
MLAVLADSPSAWQVIATRRFCFVGLPVAAIVRGREVIHR